MKKTIDTQNSALTKLNDTLHIMREVNQNEKENYNHGTRENTQERLQQIVETEIINLATDADCETQMNQVCETNEQQFQSQKNVNKSGIKPKGRNEVLDADKDIYNFSSQKINEELQNVNYTYIYYLLYLQKHICLFYLIVAIARNGAR